MRIPMLSFETDAQECFYQLLVLHLPFEKEEDLLKMADGRRGTPEELFREKRESLEKRVP